MRARTWLVAGMVAGAPACTTVFGDVVFVGSGGTGGTSTGGATSTGGSATGGTGGTGGGTTSEPPGDSGACDAGACDGDAGMMACGCSCVNVESDPRNCGRCGHDCLAGSCMNGVCQAWTVVSNTTVGTGLDSDGKYVVWDDNSSPANIHMIKADGTGSITNFTQTEFSASTGVALKGGTVAFASGTSLYTTPEGQNAAMPHAMLPSGISAFAMAPTGTSAYFVVSSPSAALMMCTLPGAGQGTCQYEGPAQVADAGALGPVSGFLVGGKYAFWVAGLFPSLSLYRYEFMTNSVGLAPASLGATTPLAIDASNVYWAKSTTTASTVFSLSLSFSMSDTPQTLTTSPPTIESLASDGAQVYFGTRNATGNASIYYVPVTSTGNTPTPLYTAPVAPSEEYHLVAAGGALFWADQDGTTGAVNIMGITTP